MLSLQKRLDCPHSYATDDSPDLLCEYGGKCTGEVFDCCLAEMSMSEQMEVLNEHDD